MFPNEGFWSRILVWRAIVFVNFTRWIGFCMSVLFRRIDLGGVMSWNTQPNCRALDDRRPVDPRSNSWSRFFPGRPWSTVTIVDNKFPYTFMPITLLQHSYCTFVIILFGPFSRAVHQPDSVRMSTFHQTDHHSWSCRTNILGGCHVSQNELLQVGHRYVLPLGAPSPGTSGSRCFSFILRHERIPRRIRLCHFSTLIDIVAETAVVSFRTLPVGLPLSTIFKNSLYTLFCSLILDHGVFS